MMEAKIFLNGHSQAAKKQLEVKLKRIFKHVKVTLNVRQRL